MKFHYYPETDSLYIDLTETASVDSREVAPGVVLDFGADGRLVGIDVDQASKSVNLSCLEAEALPVASFSWFTGLKKTPPTPRFVERTLRETGAEYSGPSDEETATL